MIPPKGLDRVTLIGSSKATVVGSHRGLITPIASDDKAPHDTIPLLLEKDGGDDARLPRLDTTDVLEVPTVRRRCKLTERLGIEHVRALPNSDAPLVSCAVTEVKLDDLHHGRAGRGIGTDPATVPDKHGERLVINPVTLIFDKDRGATNIVTAIVLIHLPIYYHTCSTCVKFNVPGERVGIDVSICRKLVL